MKRLALGTLLALLVAGFAALGIWQLERRAWKHDLIAQVDRRLAAPPVAAPGPDKWSRIGPQDEYRRIVVRGLLRLDRQTRVQAVTRIGPGFWIMAPLESDRGFTVLVNRGFIPLDDTTTPRQQAPLSNVTVAGLLRPSEPGGGFLRKNDPAAERWYSRDVAAIAAHRQVGPVAPYFIDSDAVAGQAWPRGGMTVVSFPDNHLQYALTWFAMAILLAGASLWLALRRTRS